MAGRRRTVLLVFALCLVGAVPTGAFATPASPASDTVRVGDVQIDPDDVVLGATLHANGNATWRVTYRMRLATENETAAFEEFAADVRRNPAEYTSGFERRMGATAAAAANATGREMRVTDVSVDATTRQLPQSYGVVTYRFTWTNFAAVDGPRLRAGDALAQLFLDDETTLIVEWPAAYRATTVDPQPTDRRENAVVWEGPLEFTAGQPTLVATSAPASPASTESEPATGPSPALLAAGALVLLACAGGAFYALRRTDRFGSTAADAGADASDEEASTAATDSGGGEADGEASDEPPAELLSNEERVLRLLETNGGRLKQQQVVQELGWTDAKTSQVIGDLRDAGDIETFRIGRENVVRLTEGE
ncbi:putative membrane protein [Halarchaeum rubridurum]|uniref:Putative membrane protein n=1 Tax=Halarchaeum rubridurum TaxID=489911 RepID=A0A830FLQ3_9EURY|nr:DUF4897 domain-containing protein [Halarchaeum rubridurum]MBP1954654.1 putative membrane protein [Halarchaeum rubridurum]GGM62764.1 hypothetical protein GCM10009017_11140 [Halarchaeum rubridurum]